MEASNGRRTQTALQLPVPRQHHPSHLPHPPSLHYHSQGLTHGDLSPVPSDLCNDFFFWHDTHLVLLRLTLTFSTRNTFVRLD
jgi:hypothetical protein